MRKSFFIFLLAGLLASACEEGPDQIYQPNPENFEPEAFNAWHNIGHVVAGSQPFEWDTSEQKTATTKLCEADALTERWSKMVKEPIRPMFGAGGLNWRGDPEWTGLTVDQAQQQLCQAVIGDGYAYWGDNAELVSFFDTTTRLINGFMIWPGYEGTVSAGGYEMAVNQQISKDGAPLADPFSDETARAMHIALLKEFRPEVKNPDDQDCLALNTCFVRDWNTLKVIAFQDVQVYLAVEPIDKKITQIELYFNRSFELTQSDVAFDSMPMPMAGLPPTPRIAHSATCNPELGQPWSHIVDNCLGFDPPEKVLTQPVFDNQAMSGDLGGLSIYLARPSLAADAIIPHDTRPENTDEIIGMSFASNYEGFLGISRNTLYPAYLATLADKLMGMYPALDLHDRFSKLHPVGGDLDQLSMGILKLSDCLKAPCKEKTLTIGVREIVEAKALEVLGMVPDALKDPNLYVDLLLREILTIFNDGKAPTPEDTYFYVTDDSAEVMVGRLSRKYSGDRHVVATAFHNKSDQLLMLFFKKGALRTEEILYKDAEAAQGGGLLGDGIFRLGKLKSSPRLGLGKPFAQKSMDLSIHRALVSVPLDPPVDVLTWYHKQDSLSGYWIPVDGQRSIFEPAESYGFAGNAIGASFYVKVATDEEGKTTRKIKAISSGAFYDQLDFCGLKVGLNEPVDVVLQTAPVDCNIIINYSENGKVLDAISAYVQESPRVGLMLTIVAGRVDGARYWIED